MKSQMHCLTALLATFLIAAAGTPAKNGGGAASTAHHGVKAYAMEQSSDQYGYIRTVMNNHGMTVQTADMRILIQVPKPTLTIISDETRRYVVRPLGAYDQFGARQNAALEQIWTLEKLKTGEIAGVKATEFVYKPKSAKFQLECWCTDSLDIAPELADACCTFVGCTRLKGHGLPLRLVAHNQTGSKFTYLDTKSIKVDRSAPDFVVPTGYKKVASAIELITGDEMSGDTNIPVPFKGPPKTTAKTH
jgi:hypothetical protein